MLTTLLPLLLACSSPEPAPEPGRPNLLVIDIDSLRADRIDAQRDGAPVAPNIHALAQRGVRFDGAVAQAAWTLPSVLALLTGRHQPSLHFDGERLSWFEDDPRTVPGILGWYGYHTAILYGETLPGKAAFVRELFARQLPSTQTSAPWGAQVCEWLESPPSQPFLLLAHAVDLHSPVEPLPDGARPAWLSPPAFPGDLNLEQQHLRATAALGTEQAEAWVRSFYDAQLSWADRSVGSVLGCLEQTGLAERTVVILLSDHGDELFDHGVLGHGRFHWQSVLHVPLIIHDGRVPDRSSRVAVPVQTVDVPSTLLALAGVPTDERMAGRSLLPLLDDPEAPWPERDLFSFSSLQAASLLRGSHKLVVHTPNPHHKPPLPTAGEPLPGPTGTVTALYDLSLDPGERTDNAARQPELAEALGHALDQRIGTLIQASGEGALRPADPALVRALQEQGYWSIILDGKF